MRTVASPRASYFSIRREIESTAACSRVSPVMPDAWFIEPDKSRMNNRLVLAIVDVRSLGGIGVPG